jgi:CBS-domain-containing membrane protein
VAAGKNPLAYTAELCMSQPVITVRADASLDEAVDTMEKHRIRRLPVIDERGCCAGMVAQADVAWSSGERDVAQLLREVSRETGRPAN